MLTAKDLVTAIGTLRRDVEYGYPNSRNAGRIQIVDVAMPAGPITVRRYKSNEKGARRKAKPVSLSTTMLDRLASQLRPKVPVNVDRALNGSYSTRSVLESLLVHTPEFHVCYPGRSVAEPDRASGNRHLIWAPREPHPKGVIGTMKVEMNPSSACADTGTAVRTPVDRGVTGFDFVAGRKHAEVQMSLLHVGSELGFRCFVAQNDRGVVAAGRRLDQVPGVISAVDDGTVLSSFDPDAATAARLVDCIWFRGKRHMPAVFEVEHSTGITSGLTRMKGVYDNIPPLQGVLWIIVAPDAMREKVVREARREQFRALDARFMPYSAAEELYALVQRHAIRGTTDGFVDSFCTKCLEF